MRKIDELALQTGVDIPFSSARVTIHNPKMYEIAMIGEEHFHLGTYFLNFSKDRLLSQDKSNLDNQSDFEIFMSVMNSPQAAKHKIDALMVLALLFPQHKIKIEKEQILLQLENFSSSINKLNFDEFKYIIQEMFCLNLSTDADGQAYNPQDGLARKIAEKLSKARQKKNIKEGGKLEIYGKFISILSVGMQKSKKELSQYTVFQLRDEMDRFNLKENFDMNIKARLAGAKDLEEVDNWMKDLHP